MFNGWLSRRRFRFNGLFTSSLRTSETNYLNEAFSFYAAIRGRAYYSRAAREERWETDQIRMSGSYSAVHIAL